MTLRPDDFVQFFAAVNRNHRPFGWQKELLRTLMQNERWPDRISAPTGAGKTSVIDVHAFATALSAANGGPRLPRRLAMVVDRRVLVDDQYDRARMLAKVLLDALSKKDAHPVVREVATVLSSLRIPEDDADVDAHDRSPLVTARLRGGSVPSRSWRDYPAACGVLCATPDMWGSRLLFAGYGTADHAAAQEAGLFAFDTALIVDEAHLSRQLLTTARRVSRLAGIAEQPLCGVPALQVVAVSATPDQGAGEALTVAVTRSDLDEERLARRLTTPKPVRLLSVPEWPQARQLSKIAAALAQAVTDMRAELAAAAVNPELGGASGSSHQPASTIGCYVNSVPMALAVAGLLRDTGLVVTVCGQVRPTDLARLRKEYSNEDTGEDLLGITGSSRVDVVVTTQSLEVGVDLDLAGIVTELASGSALAQRAGRVNRLGERSYLQEIENGNRALTAVTVLVPTQELPEHKEVHSGPYLAAELNEALTWIKGMAAGELGLAPWAVHEFQPPSSKPRRTLFQRPELGEAWHWARTSDELAAEPELDLWLSDSLETETSIGIVVRDALPFDPMQAVAFIRDLPPDRREVFPVPYRTAIAVLDELLPSPTYGAYGKEGQPEDSGPDPVAVRVRGEEVDQLQRRDNDRVDVRPGDVVVLDGSERIVTATKAGSFSPPVVVPPAKTGMSDSVDEALRHAAKDVLHYLPGLEPGGLVLRIEYSPDREQPIADIPQGVARQVTSAFADSYAGQSEGARREALADLLETAESGLPAALRPLIKATVTLLRGRVKDSDVILRSSEEGGTRVLVLDRRRTIAEEDRQIFTSRGGAVYLGDHQRDVGKRAAWLGAELSLSADLVRALQVAGLHHDDGKADPRFQSLRLGGLADGRLLAKSMRRETVRQVRENQPLSGTALAPEIKSNLPSGWRHEQRSVVDSWPVVQQEDVDVDLAQRLIGTSHGYGRSGFPHTSNALAGASEPTEWLELAADLFDSGGWDELIERTQTRYGVWGCAYLEAILRAADHQVSREGR